jgi:hypothetical protein
MANGGNSATADKYETRLGTHRFQRADSGRRTFEIQRTDCHSRTLEAMRTQAVASILITL